VVQGSTLNSHVTGGQSVTSDHTPTAAPTHVIATADSPAAAGGATSHTGSVISTPDTSAQVGTQSSVGTSHQPTANESHVAVTSATHADASVPDHSTIDASSDASVHSPSHASVFDTSHEVQPTHTQVDTDASAHSQLDPHGF
jgi:hypothetical protein